MPIEPSVFRQIKSNDVHQRPFKAYKHYFLTGSGLSEAYVTQSAVFYGGRIDQDGEITYTTNSDGTNQHIVWYSLKHKYYDSRTNSIPEHVLNPLSSRNLYHSASTLTIPYHEVGERIKKSSLEITSSTTGNVFNWTTNLHDDGDGNLVDTSIDTGSFANNDKNFFYMSFNQMYRKFDNPYASPWVRPEDVAQIDNVQSYSGSLQYSLNGVSKEALITNGMYIGAGIVVTSSVAYGSGSGLNTNVNGFPAGFSLANINDNNLVALAHQNTLGSHVKIPHDDVFDRFGRCDDWTISFWHKRGHLIYDVNQFSSHHIMSKFGQTKEYFHNQEEDKLETRYIEYENKPTYTVGEYTTGTIYAPITASTAFAQAKIRAPFYISYECSASLNTDPPMAEYRVFASDGTHVGYASTGQHNLRDNWNHVCVRNSGSKLEIFVNAMITGSTVSGSIPEGLTNNKSDIVIGNTHSEKADGVFAGLAEIRMYDYAVSDSQMSSLANNDFKTGSLFQTNVAGNVFHRNGQMVVSSPMPKYHFNGGVFSKNNDLKVRWRGQHTIYENQTFVRVPKDVCNVSMNPSATYTPATDGGDICSPNQSNTLPGEVRKDLFISGTLKPYITTIGLYNDQHQLVAVGKLAQPIQKRDDVDMNFIVRWDY